MAFDTSGPHCAAALSRAGHVVDTRVEELARGQAERLMGLLTDMLAAQALEWHDLDAIGVGVGPGNFTGIRISVSAARGLSLGLGIPAIGVSLFDTTQRLGTWAQTAVPAPREQYYYFDADRATSPCLISSLDGMAVALSSDHSVADHIGAMACIAGERAGTDMPAPKPLYVKLPDAAPARDAPPQILS